MSALTFVLFESSYSGRGTSSAIRNLGAALTAHGHRVKLAFLSPPDALETSLEVLVLQDLGFNGQIHLEASGCDVFYHLTDGASSTGFANPRFTVLNHAVFPILAPLQGHTAYVSDWLAGSMSKPKYQVFALYRALRSKLGRAAWRTNKWEPFGLRSGLPHLVQSASTAPGLREKLGIPFDAFVVTSLSHPSQFNLPSIRKSIVDQVRKDSNTFFLGPHLDFKHPRVIDTFTYLQADLPLVLGAVDLTVFARKMGESFGMGVYESLAANKPVLAWQGGRDRNHVAVLEAAGLTYSSSRDFSLKMERIRRSPELYENLSQLVEHAFPENALPRYAEFLKLRGIEVGLDQGPRE
jgi:hypothetical protein